MISYKFRLIKKMHFNLMHLSWSSCFIHISLSVSLLMREPTSASAVCVCWFEVQ